MPTAHIEYTFDISDFVYLRHDPEQKMRQVIAWNIFKDGEIMYELVCGAYQSKHYAFEMSKEPDMAMRTTN